MKEVVSHQPSAVSSEQAADSRQLGTESESSPPNAGVPGAGPSATGWSTQSPKPSDPLEERVARVERRQDEIEAGLQRIDRALDVLLEQSRKSLDWLERKPRERKETPS